MSVLSPSDIDTAILSSAHTQWRKVAMIIAKVRNEAERCGATADERVIAERISALVGSGQLEAQGNLSTWRQSEVKLPG